MKRVFLFLFVSVMLSASSLFAQDHFIPEGNGASNCNMFFSVTLDGEALASNDIEVAAFVDGVCNCNGYLGNSSDYNTFGQMQIHHSGVVTATFKMYDHATGIEYDECSTTVTTEASDEILGLDAQYNLDPVVIAFTSPAVGPTGPDYPWVPGNAYPDQMGIDAIVQINGVTVTEDTWEVGVFCGDECRGDHKGFIQGPTGPLMMIAVNGQDGDILNFYLYDMANECQHPGVCSTTVTFVADGQEGSLFEPIVLNFITTESYNLDIVGYGDGDGNYYLIASPIGDVSPEDVTFMLSNSYDLYYFDQSQELEWINYKPNEGSTDPGFNLMSGKGYLYANRNDVTLSFIGQAYNGSGDVTLYKDANAHFPGWNLVGNPFAQTAYTNKSFYTMNSYGTELVADDGNEVSAMQGIFVIADENEEIMNFSTEPIDLKGQIVLNVSKNERGNTIDRAIVRFDGDMLPKFMLNPESTKLYIPKDNGDFAVVRSNKSGKLPVNFKADQDGFYTINVNVENLNNLRYLHLIDKFEGNNVDLLQNPNYRFEARTRDDANRFMLVYESKLFKELFISREGDNFSFCNNGEWIINNEGDAILQVVDVNGQVLSSEEINGSVSKHIEAAAGVYMLRLINGKDIKVQKIVIK